MMQGPTEVVDRETLAPDWISLSAEERDLRAWDAIRHWPRDAGMNVVREGIDFGHATRWFLWDKVGRAIRNTLDAEDDVTCSGRLENKLAPASVKASPPVKIVAKLRNRLIQRKVAANRMLRNKRVLYCPFPYSRHAQILETLIERDRAYEIFVPSNEQARWPGTVAFDATREKHGDGNRWAKELSSGMVSGLACAGVAVNGDACAQLEQELKVFVATVLCAKRDLERLHPNAVLVPSDNTPPFSAMTHAARALGIPVILLQHGMDCERYFLDDAYASHIASWGAYRRERYTRDSEHAPVRISNVGNAHYDHVDPKLFSHKSQPGQWLWVTRPHRSEKCYAPSRRRDEGLRILDALIDAMTVAPQTRLTIKPHTFDYADLYEKRIAERGLSDRVVVSVDALWPLLADAEIVITEDSTAGMDAMVLGKPLVHAHFAESAPVMPFVAFGAAHQAFCASEMASTLKRVCAMGDSDFEEMRIAQGEFLDYAVGPRDGQASVRASAFIDSVVLGHAV
ncbi:MAG: hypothetical protein OSB41_12945 [Kiritimatiellae bacterium]|nr:hypothetical protein [Kiritimatiellia bacterium]